MDRMLISVSQRGLVHIEYAPGKNLLYLKVWDLQEKGNGAWFVNTGCRADQLLPGQPE
jgi:hypothetical protein